MAAKDVLSPVPNAKPNPAVERQMELSRRREFLSLPRQPFILVRGLGEGVGEGG
jgi:hypothetical protein